MDYYPDLSSLGSSLPVNPTGGLSAYPSPASGSPIALCVVARLKDSPYSPFVAAHPLRKAESLSRKISLASTASIHSPAATLASLGGDDRHPYSHSPETLKHELKPLVLPLAATSRSLRGIPLPTASGAPRTTLVLLSTPPPSPPKKTTRECPTPEASIHHAPSHLARGAAATAAAHRSLPSHPLIDVNELKRTLGKFRGEVKLKGPKIHLRDLFSKERKIILRKALMLLPKLTHPSGMGSPMDVDHWPEVTVTPHHCSKSLKVAFRLWKADRTASPSFSHHLLSKYGAEDLEATLRRHYHPTPIAFLTTEAMRAPYEVTLKKGCLFQNGKKIDPGTYIYVLSPDSKFYLHPDDPSWRHSSFLAGTPVQAAGELTINREGTIETLNNKSGHYPLLTESVIDLSIFLKARGADLFSIDLTLYDDPFATLATRETISRIIALLGYNFETTLLSARKTRKPLY